jgi:hypothetical protein
MPQLINSFLWLLFTLLSGGWTYVAVSDTGLDALHRGGYAALAVIGGILAITIVVSKARDYIIDHIDYALCLANRADDKQEQEQS